MRPLRIKRELFEEIEGYPTAYLLEKMLRNIRNQSLKRLLMLNYVLSERHRRGNPSGKQASSSYHAYLWEMPLKDIMDILGINRRTAMDYRCALKWMVSP